MTRALLITGPTAVGKTDKAVRIAVELDGEIISADSRQVFRHLDIGTAKPGPADLERVPHHLVDILEPGEEYSAGRFVRDAERIARGLRAAGRVPIVCGGATLYTKALREGLFEESADRSERHRIREELREQVRQNGIERIYETLVTLDPATAQRLEPTDTQRIIRALEVYRATGTRLSEMHEREHYRPELTCLSFCLFLPRDELERRIRKRTRTMIERGLVEEVRKLLEAGYDKSSSALRSVGYAEIVDFLEGRCTLDEAEHRINISTRKYAKRQLTWFRGQKNITWLRSDDDTVRTICDDWKNWMEKTDASGTVA